MRSLSPSASLRATTEKADKSTGLKTGVFRIGPFTNQDVSVDFREPGGVWPFRPMTFEAFGRNVHVCMDKLGLKTCTASRLQAAYPSGTIMDVQRIPLLLDGKEGY